MCRFHDLLVLFRWPDSALYARWLGVALYLPSLYGRNVPWAECVPVGTRYGSVAYVKWK